MHLYISPRGIMHDTNRFLNDLQAQYLNYFPKGKMLETFRATAGISPHDAYAVQLAVRPMGLFYELVFPKESLMEVLQTLWPDEGYPNSQNWKIDAIKWAMCKALGAKKLPRDMWPPNGSPRRLIYKQNVGIDLIGYKEDGVDADGNEML